MSKYILLFHEDVSIDYNEAFIWYEEQKQGLGEEFLALVNRKIQEVLQNPEAFSEKSRYGYREAILDKSPYSIVYRIYKKKKQIIINSIHHQKKHPRKKIRN